MEERKGTSYVTKLEMLEAQRDTEDKVFEKIGVVEGKVDTLNEIVLPLIESSKQTAKNTEKMAITMDEFTRDQRKRNSEFYNRLHDHDKSIYELGLDTRTNVELKKERTKIIVAVIGVVSVLVGGIFGLAPFIFN